MEIMKEELKKMKEHLHSNLVIFKFELHEAKIIRVENIYIPIW